jgi:hypothetical protein
MHFSIIDVDHHRRRDLDAGHRRLTWSVGSTRLQEGVVSWNASLLTLLRSVRPRGLQRYDASSRHDDIFSNNIGPGWGVWDRMHDLVRFTSSTQAK